MARSSVALVSFVAGALVGGRAVNGVARTPVRHLAIAAASEAALLLMAAGVAPGRSGPPPPSIAYALITVTALAMGLRNAIVRKSDAAISQHERA
jgi:uncharacterized membrane protein YoaK (UPF0700 family)